MRYLLVGLMCFSVCFNAMALSIKSSVFKNNGYIPAEYSCDSTDISPPLSWSKVPEGTKSFVLICDDPDAPMVTWVHWVILNIPGQQRELEEDISKEMILSEGMMQGINDFGRPGYGGPCPPSGKAHRYFFKLYALDEMISFSNEEKINKDTVIDKMQGHILAEAKIIGKYER
jgi:Raf kinase inhibitor-like YbhB/YbcL family protein